MGKDNFQYQNLNLPKFMGEEVTNLTKSKFFTKKSIEEYFQEKTDFFLLNKILMSVQFFDNYERDIEVLRENWYKEFQLETHHKVCFYADSLFRLVGINVKFKPHYGIDKGLECLLHPLRIFIANDNVEAAYDPGFFGKRKTNISPYYRLTVKPSDNNKKEKSGYVSLVEYRPIERFQSPILKRQTMPEDSFSPQQDNPKETFHRHAAINLKRKSTFDFKNSRTLTKTEKLIGLQNKNLTKLDRRSSFRNVDVTSEEIIPQNEFYIYEHPKTRFKEKSIHDFRMNEMPESSYRIPKKCFQRVDVKKKLENRRRSAVKKEERGLFATKIFLNSAAYKGFFCDLIVENLAESLNLDPESLDGGVVHEEFVIFKQKNTHIHITPIIKVQDWNQHLDICKKQRIRQKTKEIEWPTAQMNKILRLLPCYAVPKGYTLDDEENLDYEREWKLCFPKAEEFLILHVMHAHLRCYLLALAIYKSFIEPEVDKTSFGPQHLLHLLFWRIHKDFLAWPEDRPGETLIYFFRDLYIKLKNKALYDFFITTRNLFSASLPKDLHKAQTLIKIIIENPIPHVLRAVRNLHLESSFYPVFDVLKLYDAFKKTDASDKKSKKSEIKPQPKKVTFEDDEEREWKKQVIKQIHLEKKIEEEELRKLSIKSIDTETLLEWNQISTLQCCEIVEMFIVHFLAMGIRSTEQKFLNQALMYTTQIQNLMELLVAKNPKKDFTNIKQNLSVLKAKCEKLKQNYRTQNTEQIHLFNKFNESNTKESEVAIPAKTTDIADKETVKILRKNTVDEEECETKL